MMTSEESEKGNTVAGLGKKREQCLDFACTFGQERDWRFISVRHGLVRVKFSLMKINSSHKNEDKISWHFDRSWMIYGVVCFLLAILGHFIIAESGIFDGISWKVVGFFFLYTVVLYIYFGRRNSSQSVGSSRPGRLARFRSYLTFLPITHIIQNADAKEPSAETQGDIGENELAFRISIQKQIVIEAFLEEYIIPWYTKISSNTTFIQHCREILQSVFIQLGAKLQQVDRNEIAKEVIQTLHLHWKEYCDASSKSNASGEDIIKCFKFVHPYLQDSSEVAKKYESMVYKVLEGLIIPDIQSTLLCQFLSGILVKSFFLYYVEVISQSSWINSNLIVVLSSDTVLAELACSSLSQSSSAPTTPHPERSPKNILGDISSVSTPCDYGSSNCDQSPSKIIPEKIDNDRFMFKHEDAISSSSETVDQERVITDSPFSRASRGTPSPSTSVSSALSGVIPTLAIPLLPSGSYMVDPNMSGWEEGSVLSVQEIYNAPPSPKNKSKDAQFCSTSTFSIEISDPLIKAIHENVQGNSESVRKFDRFQDESKEHNLEQARATTPTKFASFEEARKPTHPMLDAGTLSVDGALDKKRQESTSCNVTELLKVANDGDNGRSPVYEEPEDFATSIAKLRNLLEQKENKNTNNGSPNSLKNNDKNSTPRAPTPSELRKEFPERDQELLEDLQEDDAGDVLRHQEPEKREEESHQAELKCYYHNITIPKVESYNDATGGQFDFYCIQYEGVYFDEKYEDQPRKVILRTTTVKRRFKEFLLLQSKLETQTAMKLHLKGIKAPNRWLNLSFSKADATNTRKIMLEKYLNQICTHPILGTSTEVQQFMAYGDEGFALGPLDMNDPKHLLSDKLDKLAKKFTGVINSLKDALPSFESNPPSPRSELGTPTSNENPASSSAFPFTDPEVSEGKGDAHASPEAICDNTAEETLKWIESSPGNEKDDDTASVKNLENIPVFPNVTVNVSDASPDEKNEATEDIISYTAYPLAAALTQLLCDVLWLPNCRPHSASVSTFMSLSGKSLENYVHETIDVFMSDEAILGYLEWFRKSMKAETDATQDLQYDLCTEIDLKNCLRRRIPAWVRWMWGRNRLDLTIERITGFFQNPIINRDLVMSLSELLFSKITQTETEGDE